MFAIIRMYYESFLAYIVIINYIFVIIYRNVIIVNVITKCSLFTKKFYYNFVVLFEDINFMSSIL